MAQCAFKNSTQRRRGATNARTATALDLLQKDRDDKAMDTTTTLTFSKKNAKEGRKTTRTTLAWPAWVIEGKDFIAAAKTAAAGETR